MEINININTTGFNEQILNDIKQIAMEVTAEVLISLIHDEIQNSFYDTVFGHYTDGLVNTGQYKNSWKDVQINKNIWKVYSTDDKAALLEYGGMIQDYTNLTLDEMKRWGQEQGVPDEVVKLTYHRIKQQGTVSKPAVRRALARMGNEEDDITSKINEEFERRGLAW